MKKNRNLAIYCRVSTREQVEEGFGLRDQERRLRKYIEALYEEEEHGILTYIDEGKSAKDLERPGIKSMIADIKDNRINYVYIHKLDRLTRSVKDLLYLIELFEKYEVSLVSLSEQFDMGTALGKLMVGIIIQMAQWERETISERTIRGLDQSAREGRYTIGTCPFGYKRVQNNKIEPSSEGREWIPYIFHKIAYEDFSVLRLAKHLNAINAADRNWDEKTLRKLLQNPIYIGTFRNNRMEISNHTAAVISSEIFIAVSEILKKRSRKTRNQYLFKGMLVCRACNSRVQSVSTKKKRKIYLYYYCKKCNRRVSENDVLEIYFNQIAEAITNQQLKLVNNQKKFIETKENDLRELEDQFLIGEINLTSYLYTKKKIEEILSAKKEESKHSYIEVNWNKMSFKEKRELIFTLSDQWII